MTGALLALLACTPDADPASVLLVGNSYVQGQAVDDVVEGQLARAEGAWAGGQAERLAAPNYSWQDHLAALQDQAAWQQALAATAGWEAVLLQEYSLVPGLPQDDSAWLSSLAALQALDARVQAMGAETLLLQTWGRRDGSTELPDLYPDYGTMQALLVDGYQAYAAALAQAGRSVRIAPAGQAFAAVREAEPDLFAALYSSDGSHLSAAGAFLVGCVVTETMTSATCAGAALPEGMTAAEGEILVQAADAVSLGQAAGQGTP